MHNLALLAPALGGEKRGIKGRKAHLEDLKLKKFRINAFFCAKLKKFSIAFFCKIPYNILKHSTCFARWKKQEKVLT